MVFGKRAFNGLKLHLKVLKLDKKSNHPFQDFQFSFHKGYLYPPLSLSLLRHYDVCLWGVCFRFQPFKNFNTGSLLYNGLTVRAPPPSPPLLPFTTKSCLRREKVGIVSHVSQCSLLSRFGNTDNLLKIQEGFLSFAVQRWKK